MEFLFVNYGKFNIRNPISKNVRCNVLNNPYNDVMYFSFSNTRAAKMRICSVNDGEMSLKSYLLRVSRAIYRKPSRFVSHVSYTPFEDAYPRVSLRATDFECSLTQRRLFIPLLRRLHSETNDMRPDRNLPLFRYWNGDAC